MSGPVVPFPPHRAVPSGRRGFTLVEILTATALTLVMMTAVVAILGSVSQSVSRSRAGLEMMDRLRATQRTLRRDLENVTVTMLPPRRPESAEGYFEYIEGPIGPVPFPTDSPPGTAKPEPVNFENGNSRDTSVGDVDDILMFTVRSPNVLFVGRGLAYIRKRSPKGPEPPDGSDANGPYVEETVTTTTESQVAEVAWFVRGRTLYRRLLVVQPEYREYFESLDKDLRTPAIESPSWPSPPGFYGLADLSVRNDGGTLLGNTLSDLTKPENRFAHRTAHKYSSGTKAGFPYHPHITVDWTQSPPVVSSTDWVKLGLPTLRECSSSNWTAAATLPEISLTEPNSPPTRDFWTEPQPWPEVDRATGTLISPTDYTNGLRIGEDVILTNVIGFDVKAWDPRAPVLEDSSGMVALLPGDPGYQAALTAGNTVINYGAYVDLNYNFGTSTTPSGSDFAGNGKGKSRLDPSSGPFTYDTWSFHYEHDGIDQDNQYGADQGTNGFDDDGDGVVDNPGELETSPPYPHPLRGIQVKIRVFEPDGRQVREVTIVQDFLPK